MKDRVTVPNMLLWVFVTLCVLTTAASLLHSVQLQALMPFISIAILMSFVIVHGVLRYGWRRFIVFFCLTFVISWSCETSSNPYRVHYHYTDVLGPKLWLVPLLIMAAYFSMGYLAWTLAHTLLDRFDDRLSNADVVLVPVANFSTLRERFERLFSSAAKHRGAGAPVATGRLRNVARFGTNPGNLRMLTYVPPKPGCLLRWSWLYMVARNPPLSATTVPVGRDWPTPMDSRCCSRSS